VRVGQGTGVVHELDLHVELVGRVLHQARHRLAQRVLDVLEHHHQRHRLPAARRVECACVGDRHGCDGDRIGGVDRRRDRVEGRTLELVEPTGTAEGVEHDAEHTRRVGLRREQHRDRRLATRGGSTEERHAQDTRERHERGEPERNLDPGRRALDRVVHRVHQ